MNKHLDLHRLIVHLLFLAIGSAAPVASQENLFPVPDVIKHNVEFWKKVYAVYPSNKVLIHDSDDLSVIYEVMDLYKPGEDDKLPYRQQWRKVEDVKREYRLILLNLAYGRLAPSDTSDRERRVLKFFAREADRERLRRAAYNVRGQQGLQDRFLVGLKRSGLYRDAIAATFLEHGLPQELMVLPHVESSFNYQAYSKLGAAGIWQFTRATGRRYLTINYDVDDRLDPLRSTEAAARLLKLNYSELGSWPLAITAYNHGLNGMKRAKAQCGNDLAKIYKEYRSRIFGFASRNFYAEFLAALEVASNHEAYFGTVEFHEPAEFVTIGNQSYLTVNTVLETFGLEPSEFREFNPALRPPVLNSQRRIPRGYPIRLPKKEGVDTRVLYARIDPNLKYEEQVKSDFYQVRRGDNLASIAGRLRVSQSRLAEYNNLSNAHRIYVGQILRIPPTGASLLASAGTSGASEAPKKGESSATIAMAEAPISSDAAAQEPAVGLVERERILTLDLPVPEPLAPVESNRTAAKSDLSPVAAPALSEWIRVEAEETLGHYANWLELPTQRLRELNGLRYGDEIRVGQRIRLSFQNVSALEFHRRRLEYLRSIEEDFFSTYRVDTTQTHIVSRGQNIWMICNDIYQLPVWLVAKYNSERDLYQLQAGDQLLIPVVSTANPTTAPNQQ